MRDGLNRLWRECSFTDREAERFKLGGKALIDGTATREKAGKLTKTEVLAIGECEERRLAARAREERLAETIRTKPSNYHVITRDEDLPRLVDRLREEVRLQQSDEWFRKVFRLFNETHIRGLLAERGVEIPAVISFTEWDTETSGVDTRIDLSGGYSFWLPLLNEGYYVAYGHLTDDPQCSRSKALETVRAFIESAKHAKAFHNTPFDLSMFLNDGIQPRGFRYDSMDAAQMLNEHEESNGLKQLTTKYKTYIGAGHLDDYTFEDLFGNGSPLVYPPEPVGIYAIKDVEKGWLLTKWQIDMMLATDDLYYPYFEIRQYLYEVNIAIERTGFVIDLEQMRALEAEFKPKLEQAKRDLYEAYGIDDAFVREMDRKLNAKKAEQWAEQQARRIERKRQQIAKKREKVEELEEAGKTHLKSYESECDMLVKFERELAELDDPTPENAPQFIDEFNLSSNDHLAYLIYDYLGIKDRTKKIVKKGKNRERAVSKDVLEVYFDEEESLKPLADYSVYDKLLGTYVEKIPKALDVDGRLHTSLKTISTGRYSSSGYSGKPNDLYRDGTTLNDREYLEHMRKLVAAEKSEAKGTNLQNIPARTEAGLRVRKTIVPPPGYTFLGSDLSSIEPRIQAHRMAVEFGDQSFAQMYRDGLDPYIEFASMMFDVPKEICEESAYKDGRTAIPYRKLTKDMFLAKGYGQAEDRFVQTAVSRGVGEEAAARAYRRFDEILPGFSRMVESTFDHLREHGWTATLWKQKRRFPGYVEKYKRLCVLMRKAGIRDKNDPELGKKSYKLPFELRNEFWELMRFTGGCERAAFNHTIQGSGANVLQMCMIRGYYEGTLERGWEFPLTLHDEQKHAVPNDQLTPEAVALYDDIMTNTVRLEVPLKCDTVIEPRWMEEWAPDEWFAHNDEGKAM